MSSFTWLDYSEHDRRRMLEVVDLFKEKDTRDELGIASIRDSFSERFFPGTTTIMTRARYFLLVPWTYLRLEGKKVSSGRIVETARRAETDLIEAIEGSDEKEGNIGKYARTTLKRLPSSVYWHGLWVWGLRVFPGSRNQYHRSLDRFYDQASRHGMRTDERDEEHDDLAGSNWHSSLSRDMAPPLGFPHTCSLRLARGEAEYLREKIRLSPGTAGSLLDELVTRRERHEPLAFVWQHPGMAGWPEGIREWLQHAQNFSELMQGGSLLYNLILAEESRSSDLEDGFRARLGEWADGFALRHRSFREWKRARFWEIARSGNPRISQGAEEFVNAWWQLVLSGDPGALSESGAARRLITERERQLKKALARIGNPRAQEIWNGDSGSGALDYRWSVTQRLLNDIFDGLEDGDA